MITIPMWWTRLSPNPVSTAGFTIDITAVTIAALSLFGALAGGWALVRKARIEADAKRHEIDAAARAGSEERESKTNAEVWRLVEELRAEVDRIALSAAQARIDADKAQEGEAECTRRNNELRAEFNQYRAQMERRVRELEERANMVPVLQEIIRATTADEDSAELLANHPETMKFLQEDPDDADTR